MEHIYLIGFMGSGKSTVAAAIQRQYGLEVVEMDAEIEKEEKKTIRRIFETKGEAYFRQLETEFLKRLGERKNLVVSCGGGVPLREENVREMKKRGKIVLLTAEPETVYERVRTDKSRPLLADKMSPAHIRELMEKRSKAYYAAADIRIKTDGKTAEALADEIMGIV